MVYHYTTNIYEVTEMEMVKKPTWKHQMKKYPRNSLEQWGLLSQAVLRVSFGLWCFPLCLAAFSCEVPFLFNLSEMSISYQQIPVV